MHKLLLYFMYFIVFIILCCFIFFFSYIIYKGLSTFSLNLIFDDTPMIQAILGKARVFDGLFNAIIGSFYVVGLAIIIAFPLGFFSGIYLAFFASSKVRSFLGFLYELLASVPSIVIGLFGLSVTIFLHKNFFNQLFPSLIISAISLAILITPYIIKMTQNALENIPKTLYKTALHLGASPLQNLFYILLPFISKELLSGAILAMGRAIEDTAVIMLTGAVAMAGIPTSILQKYEALPFYIYYISAQYTDETDLNRGFTAAILLLIVALSLFLLSTLIRIFVTKKRGFHE